MENIRIVRMTPEHFSGAVDVLRQSFFTNEKICTCVRILEDSEEIPNESGLKTTVAAKELEDLALDTAKDGVSFVAINELTKRVAGVAFNKIQIKPEEGKLSYFEQFAKDNIKEHSALEVMDFMVKVDGQYNLFENYDTDCIFEIMFLSVRTDEKGKGIGTALLKNSLLLAQKMKTRNETNDPSIDVKSEAKEFKDSPALNATPKCVSAIFTSRYSQECGRRNGFTQVLRVPYTEFTYKGKPYSETVGPDHPFCALSVKKLD